MKWTEMTAPALADLSPDHVLLLPLGSCEQHGQHLPVFTDTFITTAIADSVEERIPRRVVQLPTLWLGASHHHRLFAGALSLSESVYMTVLTGILECLADGPVCAPGHAKRILLLNGHGGNVYPGQAALSEFAWKFRSRPDLIAAFASYWTLSDDAIKTVPMETPALTHSCEYETSLMLAIKGELVDMSKAKAGNLHWQHTRFTPDASRPSKVGVAAPFHARSSNGALGHPELSSEEKGKQLLDVIVHDTIAFIEEFVRWDDLKDVRAAQSGEVAE
ncbi:MAG TPA: creatininase family protein [Candidatus Latescibacteria bacterium]|nr:creatininase family protein [Candidatus Latescibacterota bacterium]